MVRLYNVMRYELLLVKVANMDLSGPDMVRHYNVMRYELLLVKMVNKNTPRARYGKTLQCNEI